MAERDKYDKDILKALQKIGKHLESIDKKTYYRDCNPNC